MRRASIAVVAFLGASLIPRVSQANDMSGLIFVVVIWPACVLCLIVLGVLALASFFRRRQLARGDLSGRGTPLGVATMVVAGLVAASVTMLVPDGKYGENMHDLALISIAPVEVAAVVAFALGLRLVRMARTVAR